MPIENVKLIENGSEVLETSLSIYDFVPVVRIDKEKKGKNAIYSLKSCSLSPRKTIELGTEVKEEFRTYNVPEVVIAKNSVSEIPLKIIKGYNSIWQDNDGIVEFKCSNPNVKISPEKKEVVYGDKVTLKIEHTLKRGNTFYIDIEGLDDDDDTFQSSETVVKSGRLRITVVEKDVFMREEYDELDKENEESRRVKEQCYIAVDNQFSKVVDNPSLRLRNYVNLNAYDRAKSYRSHGYIKSTKRFNQTKTWIRENKNGFNLKPKAFRTGQETVFTDYILQGILNKPGYHFYYFALLDAYHVLTLVIDNQELCAPKYRILDQLIDRPWQSLILLNQDLLQMTIRNYSGACSKAKRKDHNSSLQLWKLKRK